MAARTAMPTIPGGNILHSGKNVSNFLATTAVTIGQVVAFVTDGTDFGVVPAIAGSNGVPIGVALNTAAAAKPVAVAMIGCIAYVSQATDDTDIDAGHYVVSDVCAVGGQVVVSADPSSTEELVGVLLEDSDASALTMERILVLCGLTRVVHG